MTPTSLYKQHRAASTPAILRRASVFIAWGLLVSYAAASAIYWGLLSAASSVVCPDGGCRDATASSLSDQASGALWITGGVLVIANLVVCYATRSGRARGTYAAATTIATATTATLAWLMILAFFL